MRNVWLKSQSDNDDSKKYNKVLFELGRIPKLWGTPTPLSPHYIIIRRQNTVGLSDGFNYILKPFWHKTNKKKKGKFHEFRWFLQLPFCRSLMSDWHCVKQYFKAWKKHISSILSSKAWSRKSMLLFHYWKSCNNFKQFKKTSFKINPTW